MSPCAHGASVAVGVDGTKYVPIDASQYASITAAPLPWWLAVFGFLLAPFEMQISAICALNPDDPTPPTVGDWAGAILGNPTAQRTVQDFLIAKVRYAQFQANCTCNSGPGWSAEVCYGPTYYDGGGGLFGPLDTPNWTPIPAGSSNIRARMSSCSGANCHSPYGIQFYTGVPSVVSHLFAGATDGTLFTSAIPSGDTHYTGEHYGGANTISACWAFDNGTPVAPPPTPTTVVQPSTLIIPGADVCANYQDVCNAMLRLSLKLDWLMRSTPPVSYLTHLTESTIHGGLTGQGDIVVSGILGLLVTLNTVPTPYGSAFGRPSARWSAARVSWSDPLGLIGEQWIGSTTEIIVPNYTTLIGYEFNSGVVATITELIAGV